MASLLSGLTPREPAVVVGAMGFIGSRLVPGLRGAMVPTFCIGRNLADERDGRVAPALRDARTVFYLATSITPAVAEHRPELVEADRAAFLRLLGELRGTGTRPTVVLTSSGGTAYDPESPPPYSEEAPVRPTSRYGWAKLRLERELLARNDAIQPVVLRLANVYGPGQRSSNGLGVIPHWLEAIAANEPIRVLGDPATSRDYVYVDDVMEAMVRIHLLAAERDRTAGDPLPPVLNIGSGTPVSLRRLLTVVSTVVGAEPKIEYGDRRSFDRPVAWLDVSKSWAHAGWRARTSLESGISETWEALHAQRARTRPEFAKRRRIQFAYGPA